MANVGWSDDIKESTVKAENNVDIEETCVNCVKNESNAERYDFEENNHATQYRITLQNQTVFGQFTHYQRINKDYDHLIGFEGDDVIMENEMIKLEAIKEEGEWSFNNFYCSKCKGIYKGFCVKCSTLLYILNDLSYENSASEFDMPTNILQVRESFRGKGVYLLRTLPKNVIFGPLEGILGIKSTIGHSWKIIDNKLSNVEYGNWMKNIVCASNASLRNLDILQFDGDLYFRSIREITEGEELLIYYNDDKLWLIGEEYLYTPQKLEKLPKVFACTNCCFGFGSNKCLMEHKKQCCLMEYSKSINDLVLVECYYCKMWMEKWEYEDYHIMYCLEKYQRNGDMDVEEMEDGCDTNAEKTQCFSGGDHNSSLSQTNHKINLQNHLSKHRGIKPFECDLCKQKFGQKLQLKMHIRNKHSGDGSAKDYKCLECPYQTNYKHYFQSHLNIHTEINHFECYFCMRKFVLKISLENHIKNKHAPNGSEKDYKCSECLFQTNYRYCFQNHLNIHRGVKPHECDICKMKFRQKRQLKIHVKDKHANNEDAKDYKCAECPYQTNYKSSLQKHINRHIKNKHLAVRSKKNCDICMKKFDRESRLMKHIENQHTLNGSEKNYQCDICMKKFARKGYLAMHIKYKHSANVSGTDYQCDICLKKFDRKNNLTKHIKNEHSINGSEKDYKCAECSYQTNYKCDLRVHLMNHKDIESFKCHFCMMKFVWKSSLTKHIKNKHSGSEKDYKCSECPYQTNYKTDLKKHLNIHRRI